MGKTKRRINMRTLTTITVLFMSSFAVATCPSGKIEYEGICADLPSPSEQALAPMVPTSDEKPSRHPEPAWERGEVHADIVPLPPVKKEPVAYDAQAEKDQK